MLDDRWDDLVARYGEEKVADPNICYDAIFPLGVLTRYWHLATYYAKSRQTPLATFDDAALNAVQMLRLAHIDEIMVRNEIAADAENADG